MDGCWPVVCYHKIKNIVVGETLKNICATNRMVIEVDIVWMGFTGDVAFLMQDGSVKTIDIIKPGDKLMSERGKAIVAKKIRKKVKETYYIYPVKGVPYTVSADHVLMLKVSSAAHFSWNTRENGYVLEWLEGFKRCRKIFSLSKFDTKEKAIAAAEKFIDEILPKNKAYTNTGDVVEITVAEYVKLSDRMQRLYKNYSMGIEFVDKNVEIDAYALGYWLGDGTSRDPGITTAEPEIVEFFTNFAEEHGMVFKRAGNSKYGYYLRSGITGNDAKGKNIFTNFMKKYDLVNKKHIPADYMFNSRENRLELLAGLVDSDGHYSQGCYDFTFKSEKLADDVIFLARTLGFNAYKVETKKTCVNGPNGPVTGTYYRFCIHGEGLNEVPSILDRKMASKRKQIKNASVTGITVLYSGNEMCYELITDSDDTLFLDDFTVVHQ